MIQYTHTRRGRTRQPTKATRERPQTSQQASTESIPHPAAVGKR
nr:MAG TPA: hypothetical protein [Caudoviricetes sp.]